MQAAGHAGAADGPPGRGAGRDDGLEDGERRRPGRLVVGQVFRGRRSSGRQRVVAAHGQRAGPVLDGGPGREVGLVDDEPADQDVDVAAAQLPVQITRAGGFPQLDGATGIGGRERADQAGQRGPAGGQREADAQCSLGLPRGRAGVIEGGQQLRVGWPPAVAQAPAERGEPDPAGGPVEQRAADLPLQRCHQPAHPRLGQAQAFCRPAEVQLVGQDQKGPHLRQVHDRDLDSCPDDINCCADRRR